MRKIPAAVFPRATAKNSRKISRATTTIKVSEGKRDEEAEAATQGHKDDEADGAPEVESRCRRKKLDGDQRRKKRKVPAKQMTNCKASSRCKGDPERHSMPLTGDFSLDNGRVCNLS
jgi:hypothetical protein